MSRIGVLGTGMVGRAIGSRLVELGYEVRMGSRQRDGAAVTAWAAGAGELASAGDFADAAEFGELVINATMGVRALDALAAAGAEPLAGKLLLDVANPLNATRGDGVTLAVSNTDSLGEQIQSAYPETSVVKALNTMSCDVMVRPERVAGDHVVFICGESAAAKSDVVDLLTELGWPRVRIVDLGGIRAARGTEAFLLLWLPLFRTLGHANFNLAVCNTD